MSIVSLFFWFIWKYSTTLVSIICTSIYEGTASSAVSFIQAIRIASIIISVLLQIALKIVACPGYLVVVLVSYICRHSVIRVSCVRNNLITQQTNTNMAFIYNAYRYATAFSQLRPSVVSVLSYILEGADCFAVKDTTSAIYACGNTSKPNCV